jgi:hypothetical protein
MSGALLSWRRRWRHEGAVSQAVAARQSAVGSRQSDEPWRGADAQARRSGDDCARGKEKTARRRGGDWTRGRIAGPAVDLENNRCRLDLALDARGAQPGEALKVAIAFDEPHETQHQRLKVRRDADAGRLLPQARARLGRDGMAQQFSRPEADGDVEDMLHVGDDPGPLPASFRIMTDAFDHAGAIKRDEEGLKHMAETVVVPQQRPCPRKQPEDDLGQTRHGRECRRGWRGRGKLARYPRGESSSCP